jgi:CHAT domain-containing protein
MILADAGLETEERANTLFEQALAGLETGSAADRYRIHNEFANSLLNRVEDRLCNFATHRAAGAPHPLLTALRLWCAAAAHYQAALQVAPGLGPRALAVVQINLARQDVILADLLRMLDSRADDDASPNPLEKVALQAARSVATQVLQGTAESQNPSLLKGIAEEIIAHVDLREGELDSCLESARRSLAYFLKIGSLAGAESCLRLSGACRFRMARKGDKSAALAALRDLSTSRCLAELLAERIPAGHTGRLLAGFFDRRADVNRQLLELLIDAGDAAAALQQSEAVRARSFQTLVHSQQGNFGPSESDIRPIGELLRNWPRDVVALEYYLGPKRAWVFVVSESSKVQAQLLCDAAGKPLASADLIQRVQRFRQEISFQSVRMRQRLESGQGFDHAWQDELDRFRKELLPDSVRRTLAAGKTVVIVPHNILHYFPFAALVTQRDTDNRSPDEMVKPRFLIDEPIAISYAPSLAAWDLLRRRPSRPILRASALAVPDLPGAPALPGVRIDVENLQAAFQSHLGPVLADQAATHRAAFSLLAEPGVVLFATHGSNAPDQPLTSCLYLYPDATNDGRLSVGEIFGKSIHADLVVMSACYSGLADRDPLPGDDLFGLQRAFLQSGTRTVVSGLWDVYDGTGPELTRGLFTGLAGGKTTPLALADAQREFLAKLRNSKEVEPWLHPYFWAMYTVTGDDRTTTK